MHRKIRRTVQGKEEPSLPETIRINANQDGVSYDWRLLPGFIFTMNRLYDANNLYKGGAQAIKGSCFKYGTQLYEMNLLLETAKLQRDLTSGRYRPERGRKFLINERGHARYITSDIMRDKAVAHTICDEMVTPAMERFVVYDNTASQKGKGVSMHRRRLEHHLHGYYRKYGTNEGYALLIDFSGYYPNMDHQKNLDIMNGMLQRCGLFSEEELVSAAEIMRLILQKMETDVSRFSDEEIERMYSEKIDPTMNFGVDPKLLTGEKMLRKGVDIGNQLSQNSGIVHPYKVDNYVEVVRACKFYGRYTDDSYILRPDRGFLLDVLAGIRGIAKELGLIINERKTRIVKLNSFFRHLQIGYTLTSTGRVIRKISPKNITRERRKLKAYKRLMVSGKMSYIEVENAFKSWICSFYKFMSHRQIYNMGSLYFELFGRRPTWKKGHSRLRWLMEHPWRDWA